MVAVAENPAATTAHRARPRTPEQEQILRDHLALVREMYAGHDPRLLRELEDDTVLWTDDLARMFGITEQRIHVLYMEGRDLFDAGYLIHPGGIPVADTSGGMRGLAEIRGVTRGRMALWALGAHRAIWNPEVGELTWIQSDSTASQVERARKAMESGTVATHYRHILQARVDHPDLSMSQIAELLGLTKAQYTSKFRRAMLTAERV